MPAIFPTIYPEEPLLSAVARYADLMAFPDENAVTLSLFRRYRVAPNAQMVAGLGELIRSLPPGHRYTFMGLAERHTAYLYLRPFLPTHGARALRRHLAHLPRPDYRRPRKPPPRRTAVVYDPQYRFQAKRASPKLCRNVRLTLHARRESSLRSSRAVLPRTP